MSKIHIDPSLEKKLNGLNEIVEFCTEQGQTRGFFVPAEMYRECMSAWLRAQVSDQEIAELERQSGGHTLAEIKKSVGMS